MHQIPSTFSSLLVSNRRNAVSKTLDPNPPASQAALLEIQSEDGALLVSRLTTEVLTALKTNQLAVNGMIAYDSTANTFMFFQNNDWVKIPAAAEHYIEGPESSQEGHLVTFGRDSEKTRRSSSQSFEADPVPVHFVNGPSTAHPGNLAIFRDIKGSEVADSGLNVQTGEGRVQANKAVKADPVIQLRNLGELQFTGDLGVILVDDLIPLIFHRRGTGADAQVCTVFGGDVPSESSSRSALVELNSTTGALLISRMTTSQRKALHNPQNGMMVYDTHVKEFMFHQKGKWVALSSGADVNGDVTGPDESATGEIPLFEDETGKRIRQSGLIMDDQQKMTGLKSIHLSTPPPYDKNYSLWADSGIVALNYYTLSSQHLKTVLARDEELHDDVESLWKALSFVHYTWHHEGHQHQQIGLMAEEVAEVAPHWVKEHKEGLVLNKSALLDSACVMVQKLMHENRALKKQGVAMERKLDHFIRSFNQRAQRNGFAPIPCEEE